LYKYLSYDPEKDFTAIALVAQAPVTVVVHPAQPVKTLADLVDLARRMPGKLNYGSAGVGTPGHLTAEMFKTAAGIDITHIPYKGSAPAITDLIGGQIQIMFDPLQSVLSNVLAGKLRAVAISSKARSSVLPDVPTIAESGYDGFETTAWWGVFAPAGLPDTLTATLAGDVERIVDSEAFRGKLEPLGVIPTVLGGQAFSRFQHAELAKWAKAVRDGNVKVD
jgi:tripartite-type tricarboxylate transporter receptor subunit TctC